MADKNMRDQNEPRAGTPAPFDYAVVEESKRVHVQMKTEAIRVLSQEQKERTIVEARVLNINYEHQVLQEGQLVVF